MAYITQTEIKADIPPQFLLEALDDDNDGVEDPGLWDAIEASVAEAINGPLGQRYTVPFVAPLPAIVKTAARVFVLEKLYQRRGTPDETNPWASQAKALRSKLDRIADGDEPLAPTVTKPVQSVTVEKETAKTTSNYGNIAC